MNINKQHNQIKLYLDLPKEAAQRYFSKLEQQLEKQDYNMVTSVIDEKSCGNLFEISLYITSHIKEKIIYILQNLLNEIDCKSEIKYEILPDIDWVEYSLKQLKPIETEQFYIYGSHDKEHINQQKINIQIEANQAFGTGHHATTLGCLELIEALFKAKKYNNILDLGTGSGILAIATAKLLENELSEYKYKPQRSQTNAELGATEHTTGDTDKKFNILATDIDPIATKICQENTILNNADNRIEIITADGLQDSRILELAPFDLIIANILANPLIEIAKNIKYIVKAGTALILSGITYEQQKAVIEAYQEQDFILKNSLIKAQNEHDKWVALHFEYNKG